MRRESPTDLRSGRLLTRIARGEHVVEIPDATKEEIYRINPDFREFIDASGIRTGGDGAAAQIRRLTLSRQLYRNLSIAASLD